MTWDCASWLLVLISNVVRHGVNVDAVFLALVHIIIQFQLPLPLSFLRRSTVRSIHRLLIPTVLRCLLNFAPQIQALRLTIVRVIKCFFVCMYVCMYDPSYCLHFSSFQGCWLQYLDGNFLYTFRHLDYLLALPGRSSTLWFQSFLLVYHFVLVFTVPARLSDSNCFIAFADIIDIPLCLRFQTVILACLRSLRLCWFEFFKLLSKFQHTSSGLKASPTRALDSQYNFLIPTVYLL